MISNIPPNEINFVQGSFCSPRGRLFEWEGSLYRGLTADVEPFYRGLFSDGTVKRMVDAGYLIDSQITDLTLGNFSLIVKHRKLSIVSYPYEWSSLMLKVATHFFIDFNLDLLKEGLVSRDVHPYNILFEGTRPSFVDFDSISSWETVDFEEWEENFYRFYLRPLHLVAIGNERIARLCMSDWKAWQSGVMKEDFIRLTDQDLGKRWSKAAAYGAATKLPYRIKHSLRNIRQNWQRESSDSSTNPPKDVKDIIHRVSNLRDQIDAVEQDYTQSWNYYEDLFSFPSFNESEDWTPKHHGVATALDLAQPETIIDIGSNRGWYAQFAAFRGSKVIAIDRNDSLLSLLYRDAEKRSLPVLPLSMDVVWPSPGFGLLGTWTSAVERLRCDMAFALALVHHLVHSEGLRFDQVVAGLGQFSKRWLLIEFIPYEDPNLSGWQGVPHKEWYNLDNFLAALEEQFAVVKIMPSDPEQRTLIFCEKLNGS